MERCHRDRRPRSWTTSGLAASRAHERGGPTPRSAAAEQETQPSVPPSFPMIAGGAVMMEREVLLGVAIVGILGLSWLVFRVAGPSRSKDAALENDEALDKYGWGDAIPGGGAFREPG